MKAPDKIYIPQHNIEAGTIQELSELIVEGSVEYIRKDALLEWAKEQFEVYRRITEQGGADIDFGRMNAFSMMINKFESL